MTQENITSIWIPLSVNDEAFSVRTRIAEAHSRLEKNNKNAHSILSFGRELFAVILWKDFWEAKTITEASELIRMRTAIAANDPTFLQQANGK